MVTNKFRVILALIVLGFSQQLLAGAVTLEDFAASDQLIDFAMLDSTPPSGPFSIGLVTSFSESSSGTGSPGWRLPFSTSLDGATGKSLLDNAAISNIQLEFVAAVSRVGLLVGNGPADYDVNFFSGGGDLLGTVSGSLDASLGIVNPSFFAGWEDQNFYPLAYGIWSDVSNVMRIKLYV